jgi:hypothetical protein
MIAHKNVVSQQALLILRSIVEQPRIPCIHAALSLRFIAERAIASQLTNIMTSSAPTAGSKATPSGSGSSAVAAGCPALIVYGMQTRSAAAAARLHNAPNSSGGGSADARLTGAFSESLGPSAEGRACGSTAEAGAGTASSASAAPAHGGGRASEREPAHRHAGAASAAALETDGKGSSAMAAGRVRSSTAATAGTGAGAPMGHGRSSSQGSSWGPMNGATRLDLHRAPPIPAWPDAALSRMMASGGRRPTPGANGRDGKGRGRSSAGLPLAAGSRISAEAGRASEGGVVTHLCSRRAKSQLEAARRSVAQLPSAGLGVSNSSSSGGSAGARLTTACGSEDAGPSAEAAHTAGDGLAARRGPAPAAVSVSVSAAAAPKTGGDASSAAAGGEAAGAVAAANSRAAAAATAAAPDQQAAQGEHSAAGLGGWPAPVASLQSAPLAAALTPAAAADLAHLAQEAEAAAAAWVRCAQQLVAAAPHLSLRHKLPLLPASRSRRLQQEQQWRVRLA